jgi:hypothetical protein
MTIPLTDHVSKLSDWLKTYPPLAGGLGVDDMSGEINVIEYEPNAPVGTNMLQNVGADYGNIVKNVKGDAVISPSISYMLFARRYNNDEFWRREASEFLTHLCEWNAYQQLLNLQPKFGNIETHAESISITGGTPWNAVEGMPGIYDFMWQLQINYRIKFDPIAFKE